MRIIFLGAPGAGKGTQAEIVSKKLGIPTISTGAIIREAIKAGTEMGIAAKTYTESGALVPDEVVIGIIKDRLAEADCKNGFILDGFPRTLPQAKALDEMGIEIDRVVNIDVKDDVIVERMGGRRVCKACGATFHVLHNPSKAGDKCDRCDGILSQRADDKPEVVKSRLETYHLQTQPLEDYYKAKGILKTVEGQGKLEDTTELVLKSIEA